MWRPSRRSTSHTSTDGGVTDGGLRVSGRPSWNRHFLALFLPFLPFSRGCEEPLANPRKRRKKAFFLRCPQVSLNPHLLNPHWRHSKHRFSEEVLPFGSQPFSSSWTSSPCSKVTSSSSCCRSVSASTSGPIGASSLACTLLPWGQHCQAKDSPVLPFPVFAFLSASFSRKPKNLPRILPPCRSP